MQKVQRYSRVKLADIDKQIEKLFTDASNDVLELMALEDALQRDVDIYSSQKKMGKVRVYDKWGLKTSERILELKNKEFESLPLLGVF